MTANFIVAPFAPANRSRAYLTRNGRNTSSHQKRKPTARDAAKLAKQKISATAASSRISTGRVGKTKAKAKRREAPRPMRSNDSDEGEHCEEHNHSDETESADDAESASQDPDSKLSPAEKVFGIFELCEMVVSNLRTHDVFRMRGVSKTIKETIESSRACQERLFLAPTSATPVTWLWTVGEDAYHAVPYVDSGLFPMTGIVGEDTESCPYMVHQPRHLNTLLISHGKMIPVKHQFQHWPRQMLHCSSCTYAEEDSRYCFKLKITSFNDPNVTAFGEMFLTQPPAPCVSFEYSTIARIRSVAETRRRVTLEIEDGVKLRHIKEALDAAGHAEITLYDTSLRIHDRDTSFPSEATFDEMEIHGELTCSRIYPQVEVGDRPICFDPDDDDEMVDLDKMTLMDAVEEAKVVDLMDMTGMEQSLPDVPCWSSSDPAYTFRHTRSRALTIHGSGVKEHITSTRQL